MSRNEKKHQLIEREKSSGNEHGLGEHLTGVGSPERSGGDPTPNQDRVYAVASPDPEVPEKAQRRRFNAAYKLRILREADALRTNGGNVGAMLRREGLYSSHLTVWMRQREEGSLGALAQKKRGRKVDPPNPMAAQVAKLEKENQRLQRKLQRAELIIDIQKKVHALLGIPLNAPELDGND